MCSFTVKSGYQSSTLSGLINLYSTSPSAGSPYNTGSKPWNGPLGKMAASIMGDLMFQAPRRALSAAASARNQPVYSYLFTEPNKSAYGTYHTADVRFLFHLYLALSDGQ